MTKVTTLAQARALPEVYHPIYDLRHVLMPNGETVIEPKPRPFFPHPVDGDQILFFVDADGRGMQIVYTERGPAKAPSRSW